MPQVYGYIRVSDERQIGRKSMVGNKIVDDSSLDTQRHVITQWWDQNKHLFPDHDFARDDKGHLWFYSDPAQSASKKPLSKRPQGQHMLSRLRPGDIIVVMRLDRVFRSTADTIETMERLSRMNCEMISVMEPHFRWKTASDEMVAVILSAVAKYEAKNLGQRIRAAHESRMARGLPTGCWVPLGWKKKRRIVDDKPIVYFAPCEAERWWLRIFRWMRIHDPQQWTQAKYQIYMADQDIIRKGARGERGKFNWAEFNLAAEIVRRGFPKESLLDHRRVYRKSVVSLDVLPARAVPQLALSNLKLPPPSSLDWLGAAWRQEPITAAARARRQCQVPKPPLVLEVSPGQCSLSGPENSGPSP